MTRRRVSREQLRASMTANANSLRDTADEMARMLNGCDDPTHPHVLGEFRDWRDFVDRVARPLIESRNEDCEQAAMQLYRKASPYFICASLVSMSNRLTEAETREAAP